MDRYRLFLGGLLIAAVGAAVPIMGAGVSQPIYGLALVGGVPLLLTRLMRRRAVPAVAWTSGAPIRFVPAEPIPPAPAWRTVVALGRVEARWLLPGSAAFATGVGFTVLAVYVFGWVWASDAEGELADLTEYLSLLLHPLAGMTVLAVHRARTRSRRDGAEEVFAACPVPDHVRDLGHLTTAGVPVVVAIAGAVAVLVAFAQRSAFLVGPVGVRQGAHVVGVGVLMIGATALGVLVARLAPWSPAPVVVVALVGVASAAPIASSTVATDGVRQLSTWSTAPVIDVRYLETNWLAHHLWIAALVVLVALLAVWIDAPRRGRLSAALAVVASLALLAGFAATRPVTGAEARAVASLIRDTERHQDCRSAGIEVCTYREDPELREETARHVEAVLAAAHPEAAARLAATRARQGAHLDRDELDQQVRALLGPADPRDLPVGLRDSPDAYEGLRLRLGLLAAGVHVDAAAGCAQDLAGDARGVLAIWLATRGLDQRSALAMSSLGSPDDPFDDDRPWPAPDVAGPVAVSWAHTDLAAGRALLDVDPTVVQDAVHQHWVRITAGKMTTDELLVATGLPPVGAPTGRTPAPPSC